MRTQGLPATKTLCWALTKVQSPQVLKWYLLLLYLRTLWLQLVNIHTLGGLHADPWDEGVPFLPDYLCLMSASHQEM